MEIDPLSVRCPWCEATRGLSCVRLSTSTPTEPHQQRLDLAREEARNRLLSAQIKAAEGTAMKATLLDKGQRVRATVLAYLPGQPHEPSNVFVVYMLGGSFVVKVAKLSELDLVGAP